MTTTPDPLAEIRTSFFVECDELLEALQDGLQLMQDADADDETIHVIFRAVHSIKGGAGAFDLKHLVHFAHRFETALEEIRSGRMAVHPQALRVFFQATDHLSDIVRACREDDKMPDARSEQLLAGLDALLSGSVPDGGPVAPEIVFEPTALCLDLDHDGGLPPLDASASRGEDPRYIITFKPFAELYETGNEPYQLLRALSELGQIDVQCDTSQVPTLNLLASDAPYLSWTITLDTHASESEINSTFEFVEGLCALDIARDIGRRGRAETRQSQNADAAMPAPLAPAVSLPATPKPASSVSAAKSIVRVDLDRIERLVNLVGELVINQAILSQSLGEVGLSPHSDAMCGLEEFQRLTRDIQDSVMNIRAQPVKSLFQRMSRIVREASGGVDKDVRLHTEGDTTEVDKTLIERLADPLTHMVRNAVDHGLESTSERLAAGKPPQGQVRLTAAHTSGRVIIEVIDDGAGINRPKVRQIAVEKGLVASDASLNDSDIDNLLFLPGFSTVNEISDLSGRGVGMDVVRTEIQSLGGRVTITSTPGLGTCFSISLPLTLAVLDGMVIEVAGETLVVPLTLVTETMTLDHDTVQMLRPSQRVVQTRGAFVPLIDLGFELGYRRALHSFSDNIALLITQEDGSSAALVIDAILDQRQVVIKGLNDSLYRAPGIAAATILGDGQIALILDPPGIVNMASSGAHRSCALPLEGIPA